MRTLFSSLFFAALLVPLLASAAPPDAKLLEELTGLPVEVAGDVAKVSKPRADVHEVVDGRALKPFQGLTSWAAFQPTGKDTFVMGDLVLSRARGEPDSLRRSFERPRSNGSSQPLLLRQPPRLLHAHRWKRHSPSPRSRGEEDPRRRSSRAEG